MAQYRIGIDVDGVLRDFEGSFEKWARDKYGVHITEYDRRMNRYKDFTDDVGHSLISRLFTENENAEQVFGQAKPKPGARRALEKFNEDRLFEVHIVTNQIQGQEDITRRWLDEHKMPYDYLHFEGNKIKAPVQGLIDDRIDHVEQFLQNSRDGALIITDQYAERLYQRLREGDLPAGFEYFGDLEETYEHFRKLIIPTYE